MLQAFNGNSIKDEEVATAQEMFQALQEARVTTSKQPLNELVSQALVVTSAQCMRRVAACDMFCKSRTPVAMLR